MVMRVPNPKTVLAVDQDPKRLLELMTRLATAGFHAQSATTADDALRIVQNLPVDAVAVNAGLTGSMDGFGLATALRDSPRTKDLPVILMASNGDGDFMKKCKAAGIEHVVSKPRDAEQVIRQLRGIFSRGGMTEIGTTAEAGRR